MIEGYSRREVEYRAEQKFGPTARVFTTRIGVDGQWTPWWGVAVGGKIIGARRELAEIPALIKRGPLIPLKTNA